MSMWGFVKRVTAVLLVVCLSVLSLADGGFVSYKEAPITMPYQRGFISYKDKTETMMVESTLNAPSGDFVWLVPTPNTPTEIKPCEANALASVISKTTPRIHGPEINHPEFLVIGLVLVLITLLPLVFLLTKKELSKAFIPVYGIIASFFALVTLFFSAMGHKSEEGSSPVHGQGVAGNFAYVVLKSSKPADVINWLTSNHYALNEEMKGAIEQYSTKNWAITAFRYRHEKKGSAAPHPISLTFKADKPVYPMILTGATTEQLKLDLVVASDSYVTVDEFDPCLVRTTREEFSDAGLASLIPTGTKLSRFRMDLYEGDMDHDFEVQQEPDRVFTTEAWYTDEGAVTAIFGRLWFWCVLLWIWLTPCLTLIPRKTWLPWLSILLIPVILGGIGLVEYQGMTIVEGIDQGID